MDLADFQKKVFNEFTTIRACKFFESGGYDEITEGLGVMGCLLFPLIFLASRLGKSHFKEEKIKKNYAVFESEADDLLRQDEIKQTICKVLKEKGQKEIITEEKFVYAVTEVLFAEDMREKFVIPLEPVLFGFVAFKISETGIQEFCREIFQ